MFKWLIEKWNQVTKKEVAESALLKPGVIIDYLINDPTTPKLKKTILIPSSPTRLRLLVHGHKLHGDAPKPGTTESIASNCYVTLAKSIKLTQNEINKFRQPLKKWAACKKLSVFPFAGKDFNAYYNRKELKFFYDRDPVTKKRVHSAGSADVVAHELGHAILDAIRPDFWNVQSLEIWAYHEAFADITAMMSLLQHKETLNHILKETKGDIRKPNVATRLAEEMGNAIYHVTRGQYGYTLGALRDATNNFKYSPPNKLPKNAPDNKLAAECHSFGRVFLGAWYDMLAGIYEQEVKNGSSPIAAIKTASQICYGYLLRATFLAPRVHKFHEAIAKAILAEDRKNGSPYQSIIRSVCKNRKLISPTVRILSRKTWDDVRAMLRKTDVVSKKRNSTIVSMRNNKKIKLSDYTSGDVSMMSAGGIDLADVEIEIATDAYYEFDANDIMIEEILPTEEQAINAAKACVLSIQSASSVGPNSELMWEIKNNTLIRTLIE